MFLTNSNVTLNGHILLPRNQLKSNILVGISYRVLTKLHNQIE